jgi:hypothetical protein|tara:strand:+ start:718 stop:1143 length:426 start_codon:yes stop_codon:yes gene_type:complete
MQDKKDTIKGKSTNNYLSLTGTTVFNKLLVPDNFEGVERYTLTINLDKDGKKVAEKNGLKTFGYKDQTQITAKRKVEYGLPKVYNADKEETNATHLSVFGDQVTMLVKQGKQERNNAYTYLERVRVDEKAEGVADYDYSEF